MIIMAICTQVAIFFIILHIAMLQLLHNIVIYVENNLETQDFEGRNTIYRVPIRAAQHALSLSVEHNRQ